MIDLKHVQKVINQQTVLDISAFSVHKGEIVAIIGAVDSGLDTLLALLTGRMHPTLGSVRLGEIDPAVEHEAFSRLVGVLFAQDGLYARQSVQANLEFYAQLYGLSGGRIAQVLEAVGLADHARYAAEKLFSGLKRRLAFGRTILHQPPILILNEPFQLCDEISIALLKRLMIQCAETGAAVLILDHDSTNLTDLCDTIHRLEKGRIIESLHPKETSQDGQPLKIPVRLEGKVVLVNPVDILYADAGQGKAILYTPEGPLTTQFTLVELEARLTRRGFFRAHRSYLVNLQHVKEVFPYTRDSYSLRLDDESATVIPLSKQAAGELKELLGF